MRVSLRASAARSFLVSGFECRDFVAARLGFLVARLATVFFFELSADGFFFELCADGLTWSFPIAAG